MAKTFLELFDKTANGYLEDLNKLILSVNTREIPLMSDNCSTMVKAGKISNYFSKIHCAAHKLAVINDLV